MLFTLFPAFGSTSLASVSAPGSSAENPVLIHNYTALRNLAKEVNGESPYNASGNTYAGMFVKLADDFPTDSTGYMNASIGKNGKPFMGTFDGNGKTIKIYFEITDNSSSSYTYCGIGLFGYVKGATIKNINIGNYNSTSYMVAKSNQYRLCVGGIAGIIEANTPSTTIM